MEKDNTEEIGKQIASLALIEVGLGSLLHSLKIPLSGHFLSLNQTAFLSRSSFKLNSKKAPLEISLTASILKSLSPAGKKLTPMLAIAAQGLLFYIGIMIWIIIKFYFNILNKTCAFCITNKQFNGFFIKQNDFFF